jgi:plastocyanin
LTATIFALAVVEFDTKRHTEQAVPEPMAAQMRTSRSDDEEKSMTILSLRRTWGLVISAASLSLALAACGGGSSSGGGTPAAANTPPAAANTPPPASGGKTVTATEKEFSIKLSKTTVAAGTYTLNAVNSGTITHALEINGPGVSDKTTGNISPTESASLTVTLVKGSYEIWCPVANHKAMGMDTHLTVS